LQSKPKPQPLSFKEAVTGTGLTRQKAETSAKIEALEKAVELVGDNPHIQEHKKAMVAELNKLRKSTDDTRSLAMQIDKLETWIGREQKRIENLATDLEEAMVALSQRRSDLETESAKLIQMKTEMTSEEGKDKKEDMDAESTSPEAETVPDLQSKELDIRRKMALKKDDRGIVYVAKRLKEMEKEADGYRDKIASAKRPKIVAELKTPTAAAATARSTS
jgi:preprotein translocase subunit SecD